RALEGVLGRRLARDHADEAALDRVPAHRAVPQVRAAARAGASRMELDAAVDGLGGVRPAAESVRSADGRVEAAARELEQIVLVGRLARFTQLDQEALVV